jgi:GNAT superfamily N-acetyltransferase
MPTLKAAAATAEITVPESIHPLLEAPLRASALLIEGDVPVCIVSCDVLALARDLTDEIAGRIIETCRVPYDNILVTCTHTHHAAPNTMQIYMSPRNEEMSRATVAAAIEAAQKARKDLDAAAGKQNECEAEMLFALGQEFTVGENSRWLMPDGQITWYGHDESQMIRPSGPHDVDLPVLAFRRASDEQTPGKFAGVLFCHSTHNIGTLGPKPGTRSPGFFGLAAQELERQHGAPFLFVPGAFGSSHRRDSHVKAPEAMTRVANAVNDALGCLRPALIGPIASFKRPFTCQYRRFDEALEAARVSRWGRRWFDAKRAEALERTYAEVRKAMADKAGKTFDTVLQVIRLGDVAIVGIPGEMFARLGLEIRRRSPFRNTIVVGLANDEIGYIPDHKGLEDDGYQTWFCGHSQLEPGVGEAMVEAALALLEEAHCGPPPAEARIEPLGPNDAIALQQFYNNLPARTRWLFRPLGWNQTYADCARVCADCTAGKRFDIALRAGRKIVGWAFLTSMEKDTPTLGIGIAEAWCGKGYGKRLMERLIGEAKRRGKKAITLIHVKENDTAANLYRKLGFQVTGEKTGSDGNEYLEMKLTL